MHREEVGEATPSSQTVYNPFIGNLYRVNFPPWSEAMRATSSADEDQRRPSIGTLAHIYPVDIRVTSIPPPSLNEDHIDSVNDAYFHQICLRKAIRGDSPTPSIILKLPGIPFRDLPPPLQPQPSSTYCGSDRDDLSEINGPVGHGILLEDIAEVRGIDPAADPESMFEDDEPEDLPHELKQHSPDNQDTEDSISNEVAEEIKTTKESPETSPQPSVPSSVVDAEQHSSPPPSPTAPPPLTHPPTVLAPAKLINQPQNQPETSMDTKPQNLTSQWTPDATPKRIRAQKNTVLLRRASPRIRVSPSAWRYHGSRHKNSVPSILDNRNFQPRTSEAGLSSFFHSEASEGGSMAEDVQWAPHQDVQGAPHQEAVDQGLDPLTSTVIRASMRNLTAREVETSQLVTIDGSQLPIQLQLDASGVRELLQNCVQSMATIATLQNSTLREERRVYQSSVAVQTISPPRDQGVQTETASETEESVNDMSENSRSKAAEADLTDEEDQKENLQSWRIGTTKHSLQQTMPSFLLQTSPIKQQPQEYIVPSILQYLSQPLRERRLSNHRTLEAFKPPAPLSLLNSLPPLNVWERQVANRPPAFQVDTFSRWAPPSFHQAAGPHRLDTKVPPSFIPPRLQAFMMQQNDFELEEEIDEEQMSPPPASFGASNNQYSKHESKLEELSLF